MEMPAMHQAMSQLTQVKGQPRQALDLQVAMAMAVRILTEVILASLDLRGQAAHMVVAAMQLALAVSHLAAVATMAPSQVVDIRATVAVAVVAPMIQVMQAGVFLGPARRRQKMKFGSTDFCPC